MVQIISDMSQVVPTKTSLNTVNQVRINMDLKYGKTGMSPGISLSILSDMKDRLIGTLMTFIYSVKLKTLSSATKGHELLQGK